MMRKAARIVAGATAGRVVLGAFLVALATLCAGAYLGGHSLGGTDLFDSHTRSGLAGGFWASLGFIVFRNGSLAMLLFSGVITAGFSTLIGLGLLSIYIGATFTAATGNVGFWPALSSILSYAPAEFLGLLIAATAGLVPVAALTHAAFASGSVERPRLTTVYVESVRTSLRMLVLSLAVIAVAALVESVAIAIK